MLWPFRFLNVLYRVIQTKLLQEPVLAQCALPTTLTLSLPCLWKEPGLTGATCSTFAKTQKSIQFSKLNLLDRIQRKQASSRHLGVISPKARRLAGWLVAPSQVSSPKGTLTHSTAVAPLTPADPLSIHYYQPSIHYCQPSNIHLYKKCEQLLVIVSASISKTCDQLWERLCKLWCCLVVDSDQDFKRWISLR